MIKHCLVLVIITGLFFSISTSCQRKGRNNNATDTLTYEIKSLTNSFNNCNTDSPDCTHITYRFPVFTSGGITADSLNNYIQFVLGEKNGSVTLQQTQEHFIKDYTLNLNDRISIGAPNTWYSQTNIDVIYQHNKIISLKVEMDDYTGGAHGMFSTIYQVFDKTTNHFLTQDLLINSDKRQELLVIAEKAFRKSSELADTTDFERAGYWFKDNKFYLTDNYCVTTEGITWLYNPYEIAPYVQGTTEIFISKEDLADYINDSYKDIWD